LGKTNIGFSVRHINRQQYQLRTFSIDQIAHAYFHGRTSLPLTPGVILEPAFLLKYGQTLQAEVNTTALVYSTYRVGMGYRQWKTADALTVMLGYVSRRVQYGYSYDITLSSVRTVSDGTHEIFLSYCIPWNTGPPIPVCGGWHWFKNTRWL